MPVFFPRHALSVPQGAAWNVKGNKAPQSDRLHCGLVLLQFSDIHSNWDYLQAQDVILNH